MMGLQNNIKVTRICNQYSRITWKTVTCIYIVPLKKAEDLKNKSMTENICLVFKIFLLSRITKEKLQSFFFRVWVGPYPYFCGVERLFSLTFGSKDLPRLTVFTTERHQLSTQHSESLNQTHLVIDFTELQFLHKYGIAIAHFKLVGTNLHYTHTKKKSSIHIQLQQLHLIATRVIPSALSLHFPPC